MIVGVVSDTHGRMHPRTLDALAGVDRIVHAGDAGDPAILDRRAAGFAAVISGHSHVPQIELRNGVLFLNPGSCGPRRFRLPVTLARLAVDRAGLAAELVTLVPEGAP